MKYWKQGFYDEPLDGSVELTDEYYTELLSGQSNGYSIAENSEGYPILKNNAPNTIEEFKLLKITEIETYGKSDVVNEFSIQDISMWLDKGTRLGLKLRFDAEKTSGLTDTSLWYESNKIVLNIDAAIVLLLQVELYASQCYDTTQKHIANVKALTNIDEVINYNFTIDYPEKLLFIG